MTAEALLLAEGINAYYGTSQALFELSLSVKAGQVMALIGRNGAGKSTTMRAIMGLLPPQDGKLQLAGRSLLGLPPYQIARAGLGYVPEDRQIFTAHTVEENLEIAEKPGRKGLPPWTAERLYELFPILRERRKGPAGTLSGGEQQMLAIARTLMGNPEILLLDEPSEGLGPLIVNQIAGVVLAFRKAGLTVLLAEQNMHFCLRVATDVTIISKGRVVYASDVEGFRHNEDVKHRYLAA
jgi:branched-chain amino acid transport system ATP-binding protein